MFPTASPPPCRPFQPILLLLSRQAHSNTQRPIPTQRPPPHAPPQTGHSSWAAAGLGYLSWALLDLLRPFDGAGHAWRAAAACLPLAAAGAVGASRVADRWHHPGDVAAGLALGLVVARAVYLCARGSSGIGGIGGNGGGISVGSQSALAGGFFYGAQQQGQQQQGVGGGEDALSVEPLLAPRGGGGIGNGFGGGGGAGSGQPPGSSLMPV